MKQELKSNQSADICHICRKKLIKKLSKDKNHKKVRENRHFTGEYRGAAHIIYNLRFNVPNQILVVFHNGSNYDYHFIINELAKGSEGKFEYLGENTKK